VKRRAPERGDRVRARDRVDAPPVRERVVGPNPFADQHAAPYPREQPRMQSHLAAPIPKRHRVAIADTRGCGIVWVNDHHRNDPGSPWGGLKQSGYGSENGWEALRSYTRIRSVVVNTSDTPFNWFSDAGEGRYG